MSSHPAPPAVCAAVSAVVPNWVSSVLASYRNDDAAKELLTKLAVDASAVPNYSLNTGLIRNRNRIWVGVDPSLQQQLIHEFHCSAWGGGSFRCTSYLHAHQAVLCLERSQGSSPGFLSVLPDLSTVKV